MASLISKALSISPLCPDQEDVLPGGQGQGRQAQRGRVAGDAGQGRGSGGPVSRYFDTIERIGQ